MLAWLVPHETAAVLAQVMGTPYNHAPCRFMQSHIRKVHACLVVTCHLHFWQNGRDLLRATAVTQGWNGYGNKSQHRKSTLEKKILPSLQQGFEPATFQSQVRHSNHWAIPVPHEKLLVSGIGCVLYFQDNSGDTPLHDAIGKSKVAAAEVLLSWPKLDLHRTNKKGFPPLHFACMKDEPEWACSYSDAGFVTGHGCERWWLRVLDVGWVVLRCSFSKVRKMSSSMSPLSWCCSPQDHFRTETMQISWQGRFW